MPEWIIFLYIADEFLVSYSTPPFLVSVKLFEIGHAIELYLKAAYVKKTGNIDAAISKDHNIRELWNECKNDNTFMPNYEIRNSIFEKDFALDNGLRSVKDEDKSHFYAHQEFYFVVKYLSQIKYLGIFKKQRLKGKGSVWVGTNQNPYWIHFLKELRKYLEYPMPNYNDQLKKMIESEEIHPSSATYLRGLYE